MSMRMVEEERMMSMRMVEGGEDGGPDDDLVLGAYVERELCGSWYACRIISITTSMLSSGQPIYCVQYLDDGGKEVNAVGHDLRLPRSQED